MLKTKIIKNFLIILSLCYVGYGNIFAVPALPVLLEITQPNGAKFKAYHRGDEYFSWWESQKGTVLFRNLESGYFEYAKIKFVENNAKLVSTGKIYDYRKLNFINSIRSEITINKNINKNYNNLREYFINKFGPLSTIPINNLSIKMTGYSLDKINYLKIFQIIHIFG